MVNVITIRAKDHSLGTNLILVHYWYWSGWYWNAPYWRYGLGWYRMPCIRQYKLVWKTITGISSPIAKKSQNLSSERMPGIAR